jgi:hypothetical protein
MNSKVIKFNNHEMMNRTPVDGLHIKDYVYSRLEFPLPDHIYIIIDSLLADMWNSTQGSSYISEDAFFQTIARVREYDILLPANRIRRIAELVLEALEFNDYLIKT